MTTLRLPYLNYVPLKSLVGQVVELTIRYSPVGHSDLAGRVRFVENGSTLWIDRSCFTEDTVVQVRTGHEGGVEYILDLDVQRREIFPASVTEELETEVAA